MDNANSELEYDIVSIGDSLRCDPDFMRNQASSMITGIVKHTEVTIIPKIKSVDKMATPFSKKCNKD
ncbi:hypothetical protein BA739_21635 [Vibrio parahaemolyticus]|nr:hypothetical protein BA739_21635 [Vibrio parahaemolyticus]OTW04653.1 hypothetical protein BA740_19585 [Vibrio parahaemolyticus]